MLLAFALAATGCQGGSRIYEGADFGITVLESATDANGNGVDDYTDILLGARKDAENRPTYRSVYHAGGYPPEDEGVCTDTVWRAFLHAGYELREMVHADIVAAPSAYPRVQGTPDKNIDFRRVPNLAVFFARNALSLTLDPYDIEAWMPGDIVVFQGGADHVAVISDRRNRQGIPYIIHNAGQRNREEDALLKWHRKSAITGHFRWPSE